ncbi:MAG: hypothetical protein RIS64_3603 [Bacteroidota bacterium]|jgi:hypothetical protein
MEILTIAQIREKFPNQWVLIGNPELTKMDTLGSIVSKLVRGVVLMGSADKRELAYNAKELRQGFQSITCIYTGEFPKGRKYLL